MTGLSVSYVDCGIILFIGWFGIRNMPRKILTSTKRKLIRLTAKSALMFLANTYLHVAAYHEHGARFLRPKVQRQWRALEYDLQSIYECFAYLRRAGYIEEVVEAKAGYWEITEKGAVRIARYGLSRTFVRPRRWDGKWRILIYDVPEKKRRHRRHLQYELERIGFLPLQESVYIFPFECTQEVRAALELAGAQHDSLLLIAESLEGEKRLIEDFLSRGVLAQHHIHDLRRS